MPDSDSDEETSTTFKYGSQQFYNMLKALGPISEEGYEAICREVYVLRTFISKANGKNGAAAALDRLKGKLRAIDQLVSAYLEDANQAEQQGELHLADAVVTIKEEVKPSGAKFKAPHIDFDTWDGKQEKFFSWMSTTIKMKELAGIHDAQAQVMVMKKLPEIIRSQCEHLTTWTDVEKWLMGRYGTEHGLLAGVDCIIKKITRTECMIRYFDEVLPEILKIRGFVHSYSLLSEVEEDAVCQGVYSKEVVDRIQAVLPARVWDQVQRDQEESLATQVKGELFGWKKHRRTCELIIERSMAMERNRGSYQAREEDRKRDGTVSHESYTKVRTKAVTIQGKVECIFCRNDRKESGHYPLSSQYCHSIGATPEQLQKVIRQTKACATCLQEHGPAGTCDDKTRTGNEKKCREGCVLDSQPLCFFACVHGRAMRTRTKAVSIQDGNKAINIPLVETWQVGGNEIRVQYDSGATITLIGRQALAKFPANAYKLGRNRRVLCSAYVDSKTSCEVVQDVEITFMGKVFLALVIKEELEGVEAMEVEVPQQWRTCTGDSSLVIGGEIDILAGGNLGRLFPDQMDKHEDMKLFKSNFTNKTMIFGRQGRSVCFLCVISRSLSTF